MTTAPRNLKFLSLPGVPWIAEGSRHQADVPGQFVLSTMSPANLRPRRAKVFGSTKKQRDKGARQGIQLPDRPASFFWGWCN
jgi:hypothetical protein